MRVNKITVRRFKFSEQFIEPYKTKEVPWGPLGYVTFKRTYARRRDEDNPSLGTEEWWETCRRCIEWMISTQKQHIISNGLEWNDAKAQKTAKEAFDRLFHLKWCPPGRGLFMAGTKFVEERTGAGMFNCAFISTENIHLEGVDIFGWVMDALMLGIGVGFDTLGEGKITLKSITRSSDTYVVEDSREGWVESLKVVINGIFNNVPIPQFDYSKIRPRGAPIKGFGGTCSGYLPLETLHNDIIKLFSDRGGQKVTSVDIVDIENFIGKCVVAGNVRRSAAIALGRPDDVDFIKMKEDDEKLADRRWGSNNSTRNSVGQDYSIVAKQATIRGEPGGAWLENARTYGRMRDDEKTDSDLEVKGPNPCAEIVLHDRELCNIAETFPAKHASYDDFSKTLKVAYLWTKTVTLLKTHWPRTNQVMLKNRRIGLSQSGIVQSFERHGISQMLEWCDNGYKFIRNLDKVYSNWLCIPRSIKVTTVKPSGTVSLLNGSTPGIHFVEDEYYIRRIRFDQDHDLLVGLSKAGYHIEPCKYSANTSVVSFPVKETNFSKSKRDVSMWEQLEMAAAYQRYWADNAVSITVTFKDQEADQIKTAMEFYDRRLKSVSFLKYEETGYEQAPYEPITKEQYEEMVAGIDYSVKLSSDQQGSGTKFCDGDSCEV